MTYFEFISQFPIVDFSARARKKGFDRHHVIPRAIQIELFGEVIDDTCVLLTRADHIKAHWYYLQDYPESDSQRTALRYLINNPKGTPESLEDLEEFLRPLDGWSYSEEGLAKMRGYWKGRPKPWLKGVPLKPEAKAKMSLAKKGRVWVHNPEGTTSKLVDPSNIPEGWLPGRVGNFHKGEERGSLSEETKAKLSEINKGKKLSKETLKKRSETFKKRRELGLHDYKIKDSTREIWSEQRKGVVCINNGEVEKRIHPEEGIPEGWVKGRLFSCDQTDLSREYKEYRENGGPLKWNEWRRQRSK